MQVMKEPFHVLEQWHYRLSIGWCGSGKSVRRRGKSDDVDQCIDSLYTFTLLHLLSCLVCIADVLCI